MKKMRLLWALLAIALFVCCEKQEEPELIPQGNAYIDVSLSVNDVYKNLTGMDGNLIFDKPMLDAHRIRVSVLLFRREDEVISRYVEHRTVRLDDARSKINLQMEAEPGDYLVIAMTEIVELGADTLKTTYNQLSFLPALAQMNVYYLNPGGYYNASACLISKKISLSRGGARAKVELDMKPIGSLITFCFEGFDSENGREMNYSIPYAYDYSVSYYSTGDKSYYSNSYNPKYDKVSLEAGSDAIWRQYYVIPDDGVVKFNWSYNNDYRGFHEFDCSAGENKFVKVNVKTEEIRISDKIIR